jgi:hypothetical protein
MQELRLIVKVSEKVHKAPLKVADRPLRSYPAHNVNAAILLDFFPMPVARTYDLSEATALLTSVARHLATEGWFNKNQWICSVHNFPPAPARPESVTLHVYRPGWFNNEHQGIHFETFLSSKEWRAGKLPIMMHILHTSHIPNTNLKRIKLSQPFVDKTYDLINSWPGYVFRAGKYGTHPFTRTLDFDIDNSNAFTADVAREFTLLCRKLGPIMDQTLSEVVSQ